MKEEQIKSKLNYTNIIIVLLGGFGTFFLSYYLTNNALSNEYPQIAGIILGVFFGVFSCICFYSIYNLNILILSSNKLKVNSIFGNTKKVIRLSEILSFNEIEKETKHTNWKDLTIFTKHSKLKISSSNIENYYLFKNKLTSGKRRNLESEIEWSRKSNRKFGIGFLILGMIFSIGMFNVYKNRNQELSLKQITSIEGKIINDVKISIGNKGKRSIKIRIEQYPEFKFNLSGSGYYTSNSNNYISKVKKGDLISLDIKTDTYLKKLTKEKELDFWDKTINYKLISIYGLRDKNYTYLTLEKYNKARKKDSSSWPFWFLLTLALSTTGCGFWLLWNSKTVANTV